MFEEKDLKESPVAVLGAGAVGKTCAADCVLGGNKDVRLFELPEFFDIAWADDNVLDELEWYDLGNISGWSEELTPEYRYVSASSVILIPAEVSRAYEALMDADGTDRYYAIMSYIPEEVTAQ